MTGVNVSLTPRRGRGGRKEDMCTEVSKGYSHRLLVTNTTTGVISSDIESTSYTVCVNIVTYIACLYRDTLACVLSLCCYINCDGSVEATTYVASCTLVIHLHIIIHIRIYI